MLPCASASYLFFDCVADDVFDCWVPNPIFPLSAVVFTVHGAVTLRAQKLHYSRTDSSSGSYFKTEAQVQAQAFTVCFSPAFQSILDIQRKMSPRFLTASLHPTPFETCSNITVSRKGSPSSTENSVEDFLHETQSYCIRKPPLSRKTCHLQKKMERLVSLKAPGAYLCHIQFSPS